MSLLRIYCSLHAAPPQCHWALSGARRAQGEGPLAQAPRGAARVQLVIPAAEVLLARVTLPPGAKRQTGSVLAFAVEDETMGEPDANQASWLGTAGNADVLAIVDKKGLRSWLDALEAAGIERYEVQCETLLLPRAAGEWSLAWNGRDGFVRTGEFEGAATDYGDAQTPPLSLQLTAEAATVAGAPPVSIAVYETARGAAPDLAAWQRALGIPLRLAGIWDWRTAREDAGINLVQPRAWRMSRDTVARLRPAAWVAGAALTVHALALCADWTLLRLEQQALGRQMTARFRAAVPDAVAVVDPALQMRRKLADARHGAGVRDGGDFLPMIENVAAALKELPAGSLRVAAYENGRLSLELSGINETAARRFAARLTQSGTNFDAVVAPARGPTGAYVITVRAS
jgi:general secretion pathway protein L